MKKTTIYSRTMITKDLEQMLKPVTGCTEPAACSLAVAAAKMAATGQLPNWLKKGRSNQQATAKLPALKEIILNVDRNTYKNAFDIAIPGTNGSKGLALAAALGWYCSAEEQLNLLKAVKAKTLNSARQLLKSKQVKIKLNNPTAKQKAELSIRAVIKFGNNSSATCQIRGEHSNITLLARGGKKIFSHSLATKKNKVKAKKTAEKLILAKLYKQAKEIGPQDKKLLAKMVSINSRAYRLGLKKPLGLGVGYHLQQVMRRENVRGDLFSQLKIKTAAATDARMCGEPIEIMTSCGSGNQGIINSVPLIALEQKLKKGKNRLYQSLAMATLFTAYASSYIGTLSPLCGCIVKAGFGTTAAIAYYLNGCPLTIAAAIQNMAGNLTGEICDGAKTGCAMKLATAASAALQSALLACQGVSIPTSSGIVGEDIKKTVTNIAQLAKSMSKADHQIINILKDKQNCLL